MECFCSLVLIVQSYNHVPPSCLANTKLALCNESTKVQTLSASVVSVVLSICGGHGNSLQVVTVDKGRGHGNSLQVVTVDKGRVLLVVDYHYPVYSQAAPEFI